MSFVKLTPKPAESTSDELILMRRIDETHVQRPFLSVRRGTVLSVRRNGGSSIIMKLVSSELREGDSAC